MDNALLSIFLSASRRDLTPTRELIKSALQDLGVHADERAHTARADRNVTGLLREHILRCRAVIHVVGKCAGVEDEHAPAAVEHRTYAEGRRSYTQFEYDYAVEVERDIYVIICGEHFPYAPHEPEPEEMRALQRDHRARLMSSGRHYYIVENALELTALLVRLTEPLVARAEARQVRKKKWGCLLPLVVAVLGLLAVGAGWWKVRGSSAALRDSRVAMQPALSAP